jgi:hypothetical protein
MEHYHYKSISRNFNKEMVLCDQLNFPESWIKKNSAGVIVRRNRVIVTYFRKNNAQEGDEYIQCQKTYKNIRSSI